MATPLGTRLAEALGKIPFLKGMLGGANPPPNGWKPILQERAPETFFQPATDKAPDYTVPAVSPGADAMLKETGAARSALEPGIEKELRESVVLQDTRLTEGDAGVFRVLWLSSGSKAVFRPWGTGELIAYRFSHRFDLGLVPPVVPYHFGDRKGTLQLWVDGTLGKDLPTVGPSKPDDLAPPWAHPALQGRAETFDALVLDSLLQAGDRHSANWSVSSHGHLTLIDHGGLEFAAGAGSPLPIQGITRAFYEQLVSITAAELMALTRPPDELIESPQERERWTHRGEQIVARRDAIVAEIQALIAARGEEAVLLG